MVGGTAGAVVGGPIGGGVGQDMASGVRGLVSKVGSWF
jgi:hypothetical protein